MSKQVATIESVRQAIRALEENGVFPSGDAILNLTGGNKGTVLRFREEVLSKRSPEPEAFDADGLAEFPSELTAVLQSIQKALKKLPEVFGTVMEQRLAAARKQHRDDLLLETESSTKQIERLREALEESNLSLEDACAKIDVLEEAFSMVERGFSAWTDKNHVDPASAKTAPDTEAMTKPVSHPTAPPPISRPTETAPQSNTSSPSPGQSRLLPVGANSAPRTDPATLLQQAVARHRDDEKPPTPTP